MVFSTKLIQLAWFGYHLASNNLSVGVLSPAFFLYWLWLIPYQPYFGFDTRKNLTVAVAQPTQTTVRTITLKLICKLDTLAHLPLSSHGACVKAVKACSTQRFFLCTALNRVV